MNFRAGVMPDTNQTSQGFEDMGLNRMYKLTFLNFRQDIPQLQAAIHS